MADIKVMFSKKTDDWRTPERLYKAFMDKGFIDPCPFQATEDGLTKNFYHKKIFLNPPFSTMAKWIDWALKQSKNRNYIAILIPARTDTKYFHELLIQSPDIFFIKGRLHYNDSEKKRSFP